jgi:hypothetical protein
VSYFERFPRQNLLTRQQFGFDAQYCPLPPYCAALWSRWIGVKRNLAVVTVDSDIVRVLWKMPPIFTNAEYADMVNAYGFWGGSGIAAVEEHRRRIPMPTIPDRRMFSKVFNTLRERGALPSARVSSERARQRVEEQENILEMVQRSPTTSTRRLSTRFGVSRTRVWRTLHPFNPQRVQNLHPADSVMDIEFFHFLHTNIHIILRFQSKLLREIANAPWFVSNHTFHTDLQIPLVQNVIQGRKRYHRRRIEVHTNPLMEPLLQMHKNRRLTRVWPTDV